MPSDAEVFDPLPLLETLARGGVDFVVIGGVAGASYGSAYGTFDLDIAYGRERDNLECLAAVLTDLGATLRGAPAGLPLVLDARTLQNGVNFTFLTRHGSLDILEDPPGAPPYHELKERATRITVSGFEVHVASLDHLIAMKEASGRPKDKLMATEYRSLSDLVHEPPDA